MNETPENTPNNSLSPADRIKQWRWKKGSPSPNPGGRPKKRPITEAYERWANQRLPERLRRTLDRAGAELPANATYADAAALGLLRSSIKGNAVALREIREAIEGKVADRVECQEEHTLHIMIAEELRAGLKRAEETTTVEVIPSPSK